MQVNQDIARRAFDAVASAQKVDTISELNRALGPALNALGFHVFVGVDAIDAAGKPNVRILFGQTHAIWESHYQTAGLARHDPVVREMLCSTDPIFWSDLIRREPFGASQMRVFHEAAEFGLKDGFMTPLHNHDGSISAVLLMGEHTEPADPDVRAAAHLMSVYYGSIARRLRRRQSAQTIGRKPLTNRQLECLRWVRAGKSSSDIADILGLSAETVNQHIATACERLGVRTRVQAVCEAAAHGIIDL